MTNFDTVMDPTPDDSVFCYSQVGSCTGTPKVATLSDCCDHRVDPVGFAYQVDGLERCFICPVSKYMHFNNVYSRSLLAITI